jgi:hypothetical protein
MTRVDEFGMCLLTSNALPSGVILARQVSESQCARNVAYGSACQMASAEHASRNEDVTHAAADDEQRVIEAGIPGTDEALGFTPAGRPELTAAVGLRVSVSSACIAWRTKTDIRVDDAGPEPAAVLQRA